MFLHIGNNLIIKKEDIIGIFDYKEMQENKTSSQLLEKIKENIMATTMELEKSIIITKEKEQIKGYLSNISSTTLLKRNNI